MDESKHAVKAEIYEELATMIAGVVTPTIDTAAEWSALMEGLKALAEREQIHASVEGVE